VGDVDEFIAKFISVSDMGSARQLDLKNRLACVAPTEHVAWRGGEIRGHVHDENAWAISGDGASGHAGLFGTIRALLEVGVIAEREAREHAWLVEPRDGGSLRAGFDGKSAPPETSSAGTVLGARTFGHLGFTGTSVWIDPDARIVVALLTNRVCPTRDNIAIRAARPRVHDELARLALATHAAASR
jgi:CubicO group peptidase (beta-lactamase class C family)